MSSAPRVLYAANRQVGLTCLELLLAARLPPVALLVPTGPEVEGVEEMKRRVPGILIIEGHAALKESAAALRALRPDYLLAVHYPHIIPKNIFEIPREGALNLHPSYLPYSRGWHTPSWAILEGTPCGASLHWIDDGVDTGDIALQKEIAVRPTDTAHTLYQRILMAEVESCEQALPLLREGRLPRSPQRPGGTSHQRAELAGVRRIDPARMSGEELLRILRGLTTNRPEEAAYFELNGRRYRVRIEFEEE